MKTPLRALLIAAAATATLSLSSCVYDPYSYGYGSTGYGSTGYYGDTMLVATSSSYWGYDPYRYCYFDYRRNCYYDPYLCGYYPVGHRPPPIAGCPHPHGWRPGHGVCPPPHNPGSNVLANYHNRLGQLQATNYAWRSQVRQNQQSQLAHMRANQEAWRNRVQQAQPVTPANQVVRRGTPNPGLGAPGGNLPAGGGTIRRQNISGGGFQGPPVQGQGGPRFQPGNSGRPTRQTNLPVNTGQQQAAAQAQARAVAQPQVQAPPPPPPPAPVQAARENPRSSSSDQPDRGGRSSRR